MGDKEIMRSRRREEERLQANFFAWQLHSALFNATC
ncbi:hypothetical protein TBK1r_35780 [Stieleria magnilauensis]|uniref:Uncharacterized protein n=1 Tax=Stieleria magnilauensis TaxID=2527963 RepID=A0ABX5XS91_9BACT|nr:hypothetical protein TBK1r_35780 [Planctomycetes bacterium TBK1r]